MGGRRTSQPTAVVIAHGPEGGIPHASPLVPRMSTKRFPVRHMVGPAHH